MIDLEAVCFQIISNVGEARSNFILAISEAKKGNYYEAEHLIKEGSDHFAKGHDAHLTLLGSEVEKDFSVEHILLIHAEDQLMSAESFRILANEFIDVYKRFDGKE